MASVLKSLIMYYLLFKYMRLIKKGDDGFKEAHRGDASLTMLSCKTKWLVEMGRILSCRVKAGHWTIFQTYQ